MLNDDFAGSAVYKGLAIASADVGGGSQQYIYATDFHNGRSMSSIAPARPDMGRCLHGSKLPKGYARSGSRPSTAWCS